MSADRIPALLEPIQEQVSDYTASNEEEFQVVQSTARLLAAIEAVIGEIADTDLETNEAQQGDLADRILAAVVAALGGEA